ncbi:MAG: lipopolysaccharide biosynthesis protein [Candidatus Aminicenantes bacterium]|nr:lipopolysaccharide biosynthesis protein [Candidatus Aminicenantes bacterium]
MNGLALILLLKKLSPREIGLVSIAAVFVTVLGAVSEVGFEAALIQAETISKNQKNGVFWIGLFLSGLAFLSVFSAAPFIAHFYREPSLSPLLRVYLLVLFANALKIIPYSQMVRRLEFGKISVIESVSMVVSSVLMIFLAFKGMGAWSLVIAEITRVTGLFIGSQAGSFFVPGIKFSVKEVAPLFRFGFFATMSRIFYNLYINADYLIVGKFFGTAAVGIYTVAYRLVFDTLKAGTGVINKVAYPTFARLQKNLLRLKRAFFSIARMNLAGFGLFLVITALYSDWVMLVLGYEKWLPAVPIIRLFCIIGLLRCVIPLIPQLLNALGHSKLNFYYSALCAAVLPAAFFAGAQISIYGVVGAWLVFYPLVALQLFFFALKHLSLSWREFAGEFISSSKILLMTIPAVFLCRIFFKHVGDGWKILALAVSLLLSITVGMCCVFLFDKQIAKEFTRKIRKKG